MLTRFLVYWPILALPLALGGARAFLWSFIGSVFLAGFGVMLVISGESSGIVGLRRREAEGPTAT